MIKFNKPTNLNGAELLQELNDAKIAVNSPLVIDGNGDFWIDVLETDKTETQKIINAHNGTINPPLPTLESRLRQIGLSIDDIKSAING